jgi:hypothetical protein
MYAQTWQKAKSVVFRTVFLFVSDGIHMQKHGKLYSTVQYTYTVQLLIICSVPIG